MPYHTLGWKCKDALNLLALLTLNILKRKVSKCWNPERNPKKDLPILILFIYVEFLGLYFANTERKSISFHPFIKVCFEQII